MIQVLEFERPIADLESKIEELSRLSQRDSSVDVSDEIERLRAKADKLLKTTYEQLDAWQVAQVARHPDRPHFLDYVDALFEDFTPLAGDRAFKEDHALIGGFARFHGERVMIIGQEKGHDMTTRVKHNFGMARPEGYRKAVRLFDLADRFSLPILSFVDTSGAYPGIGAEERGQAEAIAQSVAKCLNVTVPMIATIIGEGGSGGAIAIAAADTVLMLENSIYSVISPEGCASILWRDRAHAGDAAKALKITAKDLRELGVIDDIIPEPLGGAHRDRKSILKTVDAALEQHLQALTLRDQGQLKAERRKKYLAMGRV